MTDHPTGLPQAASSGTFYAAVTRPIPLPTRLGSYRRRAMAAASQLRSSRLVQDSLLSITILGFGKVAGIALIFVVSLILTPDQLGIFVFARSVVIAGMSLLCLGFSSSAMNFVPKYLVLEQYKKVHGFFVFSLVVPFAVGLSLNVFLLFPDLQVSLFNETLNRAFYLCMPAIAAGAVLQTATELGRSLGYIKLAYVPLFVLLPLLILVSTFGTVLLVGDASVEAIVWPLTLSHFLAAAIIVHLLYARLPKAPFRDRDAYHPLEWLANSLPLTLPAAAAITVSRGSLFILSGHVDLATIGLFGLMLAIVALMHVVGNSVFGVQLPSISAAIALQDLATAGKRLRHARVLSVSLAIPATIAMFVGVYVLFPILYPALTMDYLALFLLALAMNVFAFIGPMTAVVAALNQHHHLPAMELGLAVLTIAAALLLIPPYGLVGAAAANLFGAVARAAGSYYLIHVRAGVPL